MDRNRGRGNVRRRLDGSPGRRKLLEVFGRWPSFHDAEVLRFTLDRAGSSDIDGPTADCTVHVWETTPKVDANGYFIPRNHALVTLRFLGVADSEFSGFNAQNVLWDLVIETLPEHQADEAKYAVTFPTAYGFDGGLKCRDIEVAHVVACNPEGHPLPS